MYNFKMADSTLQRIFTFLRKPSFDQSVDKAERKILNSFKLYLIFLIPFTIAIAIRRFLGFRMMDQMEFIALEETLLTHFQAIAMNVLIMIISVIHEELSFRLMIKKFKLRFICISISLVLGSFIYDIVWEELDGLLAIPMPLSHFVYMCLFSVIIFPVIYFGLFYNKWIENVWNNNLGLIYYLSAVLFAIAHYNFSKHPPSEFIYIPIVVLPQFLMGLCFGYIRVKYGLLYAIIIHFINNLPALVVFTALILLSN
jgi:hypothetical protein